MKRILALWMVLVLLISATACGGGEETLVGEWEASLNLSNYMNNMIDDEEMKNYLKVEDFKLIYHYTFKEDGSFKAEIDQEKAEAAYDKAGETFKKGARDYIQAMIDSAGGGTTVEELLALSGATLDSLVQQAFGDANLEDIIENLNGEGSYKADGDKLYLVSGGLDEIEDGVYNTYKLSGNKLTIEKGTTEAKILEEYQVYPMVFKRK